jgi:uncharacterized protein (TIGR04255 family)
MHWKLAHENHAIERVSISFQFKEPLPSKSFQALIGAVSGDYPKLGFAHQSQQFVSRFMVSVGGEIVPSGFAGSEQANPPVSGWLFRSVSGTALREEVSIKREQLTYSTLLYDRWANFTSRLRDLLWKPLDQAIALVELDTMKLEYWDRFNAVGDPENANYRELLKAESKYIPAFPLDANDLWHSHVGFFAPQGASKRRLVNLNVDVLDVASPPDQRNPEQGPRVERSVGIYTMAQDTVDDRVLNSGVDGLTTPLDEMHRVLNDLLADIITEEASKRIGLYTQARE